LAVLAFVFPTSVVRVEVIVTFLQVPLQPSTSDWGWPFLSAFAKWLLASCLSVRLHGTTRLPCLIYTFSKICWKNLSCIMIWQ